MIFDKTGTLTLGRPEPINVAQLTRQERSIILALARASRHPLSIALAATLQRQGVVAAVVDDLVERPGVGVRGTCDGCPVALERPSGATAWAGLASEFISGSRRTLLTFADAMRPDAVATTAQLRTMGLEPIIASGDRPQALYDIAIATDMLATGRMTPQAKLAMIERLKAQGHRVLMVGDGLNDGPALAAGHVSLAPSSASDASQLAADAVFLGDSLAPVAIALRTARRTLAVVRQNFALAVGYNVLAVPLAIAGMVTPLVAALAMSGSSIIVVANALRLRSAAT
ncbi:HAD-IC family P-type ATPase [Sphingobium sp. AN641]|uniref:HAD-IC family P-type ATPase n=1 Tax=Sphingobium sp. AN641 TaxID=3133443 RepID=UPI004040B327